MCGVWRLAALATVGGDLSADCSLRWGEDQTTRGQTQALGPDPRAHAHTGQPEHTGQKAHAHLCVVALLGGCCGWLSLLGGRRESELPPTFVSVRSVVTDLSTCVAYVSAHLKHTCVNLTITVPFYKTTVLRVFELTGLVTMGRSMAIYWPFNGHFHMQLGTRSLR